MGILVTVCGFGFGLFVWVCFFFFCWFVFFLCKFAVAEVAEQALQEVNDFTGLLVYRHVILLQRMAA